MTDNRTTELLPCPFCGGEANTQIFEKTLNVGCPRCDIRTRFMLLDDLETAIAAWNTRAELGSEINGETSDGYHTFNELYHHRAVLFSVIVANHRGMAWKARKHHDGTMYDGMFIVGVETPWGQASYHYDLDPYWGMFDCEERETAPEWDGHTPDDAIERIGKLATLGDEWDDKPFVEYVEHVAKEIYSEAFALLEGCDEPDFSAIDAICAACEDMMRIADRWRRGR